MYRGPERVDIYNASTANTPPPRSTAWAPPSSNTTASTSSKSVSGVIDPGVHKTRRAALNHSSSRRTILELEPLIQTKVAKLCRRLKQDYASRKRAANMHNAFQALTIDTVTDFAYATSYKCVPVSPAFADR